MIIIKAHNQIINLENVQGISVQDNTIFFDLPEDQGYSVEYPTNEDAQKAFDKAFDELAHTPGVDGVVLD